MTKTPCGIFLPPIPQFCSYPRPSEGCDRGLSEEEKGGVGLSGKGLFSAVLGPALEKPNWPIGGLFFPWRRPIGATEKINARLRASKDPNFHE